MATHKTHRKIRLKKTVLIKGAHTPKGTVLSAPAPLAQSLVGDGVAEFHEDEAAEVAAQSAAGVTAQEPMVRDADPKITKVSDPAPAPMPTPKSKAGK
ncbi:MAG: hypothetical protein ACRD4R_06750 [Candidatus Acidiferrales bacterium]